jgi:hypothetical protein
VTTSSAGKSFLALLALGACGTDATSAPEIVVEDATMGHGVPSIVGAGHDTVYWSIAQANTTKLVFGSSLANLPADASELGESTGPIVQIGDHVVLATSKTVVRTGVATPEANIMSTQVEAVGEGPDGMLVWFSGGQLQWGASEAEGSAMLRIARASVLRASTKKIYIAGTPNNSTDARLVRFDRATNVATTVTGSMEVAELFPGGIAASSQYRGKLVGADDAAALWLVTETHDDANEPSRAILVSFPVTGEPSVLLEHIGAVSAFFATPDGFYWQEGDAVLSAPTSGGPASIEAHITGQAGAVADGYVYYVNGTAIERLAVD